MLFANLTSIVILRYNIAREVIMSKVTLRKSGGATIVSLPKAILEALDLDVGAELELSINDRQLVLTPVKKKQTLEQLLADCDAKAFARTEEDEEWLASQPVGKELL